MNRVRNVLKREERIGILKGDDRFVTGQSPVGLPKVRVVKTAIGKKKKKAEEGDEKDKKGAAKKK